VIWPGLELSPDCLSGGVSPSHEPSGRGDWKRCQSPPSSRCSANAVNVSTPRNALNLATVGHGRSSCASRERRSSSALRRATSPSTAASRSMKASLAGACANVCWASQRRCASVQVVFPDRRGRAAVAASRYCGARGPGHAARARGRAPACTSKPTTVMVPFTGPSFAWGQPEPVSGQTNPRTSERVRPISDVAPN